MRNLACLSALVFAALVSCESKNKSSAGLDPRAAPEVATKSPAPSAPAGEASSPPPAESAPPIASASAVASAGAPGPCPPNAKRYDEPKFCVVLPDKPLDVSYEGGPSEGSVELEVKGNVLRFTWVPIARMGKESLRAQLERVEEGYELAGSGDLANGAWSDWRKMGDSAQGKHVVQSAIKTPKLLINCNYSVDDAQAEQARDVCKSVRAY